MSKHPSRPKRQRERAALTTIADVLENLLLHLFEDLKTSLLGKDGFVERSDLLVRWIGNVGAREHALGFLGGEPPGHAHGSQER